MTSYVQKHGVLSSRVQIHVPCRTVELAADFRLRFGELSKYPACVALESPPGQRADC